VKEHIVTLLSFYLQFIQYKNAFNRMRIERWEYLIINKKIHERYKLY